MRVIIKPFGVLILVAVLAALSLLAFFRLPWGGKPPATLPSTAVSSTPSPPVRPTRRGANLLEGQEWELVHAGEEPTSMIDLSRHPELLPSGATPATVYRVTVRNPPPFPWAVGLHAPLKYSIAQGESLRLVFHARSPEAATVAAVFEETTLPFNKSLSREVRLKREWAEYSVPFVTVTAYKSGESEVTFHCGYQQGTVEIADVRLLATTP